MKKILLIVVVLGIAGLVYTRAFRVPTSGVAPTGTLSVVTSLYPYYYFAQEIAGDTATVYTITPAGAEPHDYEPTAQDMARIEQSDLLILNGGMIESWGANAEAMVKGKPTRVLVLSTTLADLASDTTGAVDPHIWLDPIHAQRVVDLIEASFIQIAPANADRYRQNATYLRERLSALDTRYKNGLAVCQKKDIITTHAAFGYLARAYNLHQVPITGLSPDEEPSPRELAAVADFAKRHSLRYIFFETLISPKLADTVAREVGVHTLVLNPLEGLGASEITAGKNYFTEMDMNLTHLKIALECQ